MTVKTSPWRCHVITLDADSQRFQSFRQNNPALRPEVFQGLRGDCVSPQARIEQGLITQSLAASGLLHEGAFGCGMSHRQLWLQALETDGGVLILEDDVVTHPDLPLWIDANQHQLLRHDVTRFTVNTDSILTTISPQGLEQSSIFQPKHPDKSWIDKALNATKISQVHVQRLLKAFGMCCYFLSPAGARKFLDLTFPLTLETSPIPMISNAMPGFSIDRRLNAFYPSLQALITIPFLAYTPNIDSHTQG